MISMVNQITRTILNSSMLISDPVTHVSTIIRAVRCPRKDHLHCWQSSLSLSISSRRIPFAAGARPRCDRSDD
jgi:hypothetical protein